jgi:hypothetical protein
MILATLIVSTIAALFGLGSFLYQRKQANIAEKDFNARTKADREDNSWVIRYQKAQEKLCRITPNTFVQEPGHNSLMSLYNDLLEPMDFRIKVESYIVEKIGQHLIQARPVDVYRLRSTEMRDLIGQLEKRIESYVVDHPTCRPHLYGPEI